MNPSGILRVGILWLILLSSCQKKHSVGETNTIFENKQGLYTIVNGKASMKVDANTGARIVSLTYKDQELLTDAMVHPENFGSTLWTAPQSEWGWPPSPTLDVEPYQIEEDSGSLHLRSAKDQKTGYEFQKIISQIANESAFLIQYIIKNISDSSLMVAPWEVTRVPPNGLSFFPADSSNILSKSNLPIVATENYIWFDFEKAQFNESKKLFANGEEGWLAHIHQQILFVKTFPDIDSQKVAPGEEEVEIYAHGDRTYIELENQGKYTKLSPGDSLIWPVKWFLATIPETQAINPGNEDLVEKVKTLITQ